MSYMFSIFCKSRQKDLPRAVADFVLEGVYFQDEPRFEFESVGETGEEPSRLVLKYDELADPIVVDVIDNAEGIQDEVQEARDAAELAGPAHESVKHKLEGVQRVISLHVDRGQLSDEAWFMLDSLEAELARTCDGVVYAPDDGFYDKDLHLIARIGS